MEKVQIKRLFEGAVIGGVVLSALLFGSGWAVRSSTAEDEAYNRSKTAVAEELAAICVAQFDAAADKDVKLEAMIAIDSWKRGAFVLKQGWATMPGSKSPTAVVADECATRLVARKA